VRRGPRVRWVVVLVGPAWIGWSDTVVFATVNQVLVRLCARRFGLVFPDHARACCFASRASGSGMKSVIAFLTDGWCSATPERSAALPR